jgi:signal transduction histidine kinase
MCIGWASAVRAGVPRLAKDVVVRLTVAQKLSIALSALALLALLTQALVQFGQEYRRALQDTEDDGLAFGRVLAEHSERRFAAEGLEAAREDLATPSGGVGGVRTRLVVLPDETVPDDARAELVAGRTATWRPGLETLVVAVPVTLGMQRAALVVQQDLSVRRSHLVSLGVQVFIVALLLAVLSLVLARGAGEVLVGRPVAHLREMAGRVGAGDTGARVQLASGDELEELGRALNHMAEQLAAARAQVARETEARIAALEDLRHADRLATVGKLAAGVAHELGTPLNVVLGRAQLIAESDTESAATRAGARTIAERVEAMARLIRSLLDFARRKATPVEDVQADALLSSVSALLGPMASGRDVALKVEPCAPTTLRGDPAALTQVLSNLVVNAVQASPVGGQVTLSCEAREATPPPEVGRPRGRYARLLVHDEGAGVPHEIRRHLFEPFFTTKDVGEGTGLGLAIAWGIARDHEGWLALEHTDERGTDFALYLPLDGAAPAPLPG